MSEAPPTARPTVRAIVLDDDDRVLLQAYLDPTVHGRGAAPHEAPVWIAPGGGLERGETAERGLARELADETGLAAVAWGPWLWRRDVELRYQGQWRRFEERYRLGRVAGSAPPVAPTGLEPHEREALRGHRWWSLDDLRRSDATVYPPRLAELLAAVLEGGPPGEPIDISAGG